MRATARIMQLQGSRHLDERTPPSKFRLLPTPMTHGCRIFTILVQRKFSCLVFSCLPGNYHGAARYRDARSSDLGRQRIQRHGSVYWLMGRGINGGRLAGEQMQVSQRRCSRIATIPC
jgi:hypothetical protein